MKTTSDTADVFGQFTSKTIEALTLWTDANQKIVKELAALSTSTLKEGVELCARLQTSSLDVVKGRQMYWLRHQSDLPKLTNDPVGYFHANLVEVMQETQKDLKVFQESVQATVQAVEHIQVANDKASKEIQETCSNLTTGLKDVCSLPQD